MRRTAVGAALAVLAAAPGCGQPATLDAGRTEASVLTRLEEAVGVSVPEVDCPADVEVEAGGSFRCRATIADEQVDVAVEQVDGDGGLTVEPVQAVLVTERVVAEIAEVLGDRFARTDAEVACPGPAVRVVDVGATFTCRAEDGGEARTIEVRVRDAVGALAFSLAGPEGGAGTTGG